MTRLTDEELDHFEKMLEIQREVSHPDVFHRQRYVEPILVRQMEAMLTELRARRQAELSDVDVYALEWARGIVEWSGVVRTDRERFAAERNRALAILDRLAGRSGT